MKAPGRRAPGRPKTPTLAQVVAGLAERATQEQRGREWPSERWAEDPVTFARTILGVDLWTFQIEFLEAIRDNRNVTVAGGRKIGKDFAVAVAALWWFASFPDARVILLAPSAKQLDGIVYREIKILFQGSGTCLDCRSRRLEECPHSTALNGRVGMLARTGIKADDYREIVGMTAVSGGSLRGFSGARILAIVDEASDVKDQFHTALIGNLAGGDCHRVLISNPVKSYGVFYDSFHTERSIYKPLQVSSEDVPNIAGGTPIRGLADREWLEEREIAWGRGSPLWKANVEGRFVWECPAPR